VIGGFGMPSVNSLTFDTRQALLVVSRFVVDISMHPTQDTFNSVNISSTLRLIGIRQCDSDVTVATIFLTISGSPRYRADTRQSSSHQRQVLRDDAQNSLMMVHLGSEQQLRVSFETRERRLDMLWAWARFAAHPHPHTKALVTLQVTNSRER
jgi:hypothetical protein